MSEICEFCECEDEGIIWDENLRCWLCERHFNVVDNPTGYCSRSCMLGYGCDGSC